jgi:hypothetical protein
MSSEKVAENSRFWRFGRQQRQDAADVVDESPCRACGRLRRAPGLDLRQADGFLVQVVEQAARSGDQDIDAAAKASICG